MARPGRLNLVLLVISSLSYFVLAALYLLTVLQII